MMRSYVCQQCRLQLSRRLPSTRHPQWQSKATIVSFRKTPHAPRPHTEAQQPSKETDHEGKVAQDEQHHELRARHRPLERDGPVSFRTILKRPEERYDVHDEENGATGRYSRAAQPTAAPRQHKEEQHGEQGQYSKSSSAAVSHSTTSVAQAINKLAEQRNIKGAWDLFEKTYTSRDVPALTDPSLSDIHLLTGGRIFNRLSSSITSEFAKGNDDIPTPTEVLFRYEQLDIAPARIWNKMIAHLTSRLLYSMAADEKHQVPRSATSAQRDTEAILAELLSVWRLFFQRHGTQQHPDPLESISSEWKSIPDAEVQFEAGKNFGERLQQFHRLYPTSPELQFSAIAIFNYFYAETQPPRAVSDSLREQNKPFLQLVTSTLAGSNIRTAFRHADVDTRIQHLDDDFRKSIAAQMDLAPSLARRINGLDVASATPEETASHMQEFFLRRIGRQVMMQANVRAMEKLWFDAETMYKSSDGKPRIPPAVYNAFLSGFMTLFQPEHTVRVWNHMMAHGVVPDLETWNAMLMGCAKGKDLNGINAVWDRMLRSGIEPDQRCWTTRVHAMISDHAQVNAGLAVLDEMGKRWLSAENQRNNLPKKGADARNNAKLVNNFTKPAIGVINGAVDAIIQLPTKGKVKHNISRGMTHEKKVSYVHKVLQWAGNFSIKPDGRTYNALIKLYLGGGDYRTVFKLLRQMEMEGIEGDLATHSMLLSAAFNNQKFDALSPQKQVDRLFELFAELEEGGMKPNTYIYQIAVDRLLKDYGNYLGVRAIIDHMMSRGFAVSPQIYTSLVTHYFQQEPPAIKEIDSLVGRILGPPAAPTDRFLFDRIVEGYARHGEIPSMMTVLTKMGAHSKRPSFRALSEVVKALYSAGDWDRARAIVRDVQLGEGVAKDGPSHHHGVDRNQFFYTIQALTPELLESLAGEHFTSPIQGGKEPVTQVMGDDVAADEQQEIDEQAQTQYEQEPYEDQSYDDYLAEQQLYGQVPHQQQPYDPTPYEQAQMPYQQMSYRQTPYQQTREEDNEFVNAQHAGYLSDEPKVPYEQQGSASNQTTRNRQG